MQDAQCKHAGCKAPTHVQVATDPYSAATGTRQEVGRLIPGRMVTWACQLRAAQLQACAAAPHLAEWGREAEGREAATQRCGGAEGRQTCSRAASKGKQTTVTGG